MLKVEAMDGDRGINDPVIYSISRRTWNRPCWAREGGALPEPLEELFLLPSQIPQGLDGLILQQDGVITVNSPLTEQLLEEDEEVQVQVTVSEGATAPCTHLCTPTLCTPHSLHPL